MSILIRNGTVVNCDSTILADLLTEEGSISVVGSAAGLKVADRVIDAAGMYLLPGGVDPHVHMHLHTPPDIHRMTSGPEAVLLSTVVQPPSSIL